MQINNLETTTVQVGHPMESGFQAQAVATILATKRNGFGHEVVLLAFRGADRQYVGTATKGSHLGAAYSCTDSRRLGGGLRGNWTVQRSLDSLGWPEAVATATRFFEEEDVTA